MFQQKQITWVLWRGTNLSKHDTGQERPLTVIMMCRLVLDGGPWWPHQEGASKPFYHDSALMDVRVVEGQGRWRLESWRWGEEGGCYKGQRGLYTIVNTYNCNASAAGAGSPLTLACLIRFSVGHAVTETKSRSCVVSFQRFTFIFIFLWVMVSCFTYESEWR